MGLKLVGQAARTARRRLPTIALWFTLAFVSGKIQLQA